MPAPKDREPSELEKQVVRLADMSDILEPLQNLMVLNALSAAVKATCHPDRVAVVLIIDKTPEGVQTVRLCEECHKK